MLLVGVTGGIGAGKTKALREFGRFGAQILDADDVVHEFYVPGSPVVEEFRCRWGARVLDSSGAVDCAAVACLVFNSTQELNWLNHLIHPLVKQRILAEAAQATPGLFCSIPLLFETGWEVEMSVTIAVWCDPETQWSRLRERGWSDREIEHRLENQMDMNEKLTRSDYGIINNGSLHSLREQCKRIFECIVNS